MKKTKIAPIILLLLIALVITGCSSDTVRLTSSHTLHSNDQMSQHNYDKKIAQPAWYETESIDPDWPF